MLKIVAVVLFTIVLIIDFMSTLVERKIQPIDILVRSGMLLVWVSIIREVMV